MDPQSRWVLAELRGEPIEDEEDNVDTLVDTLMAVDSTELDNEGGDGGSGKNGDQDEAIAFALRELLDPR